MASDTLTQKYLRALTHHQRGGSVDIVFRGARRWGGEPGPDKFGGSAKDMFRTVAPYIARGASKFLLDTASSFAKGADLKDALKGAVLPALMGAFSEPAASASSAAKGKPAQAGKGRLRRLLGIKASEKSQKTRKVGKTRKSQKTCKARKTCKTRKTRKTRKVKQAHRRKASAESLNF